MTVSGVFVKDQMVVVESGGLYLRPLFCYTDLCVWFCVSVAVLYSLLWLCSITGDLVEANTVLNLSTPT